jgi:hypothetical protein
MTDTGLGEDQRVFTYSHLLKSSHGGILLLIITLHFSVINIVQDCLHGWIYFAQARDRGWAVMYTVTNIWGPQTVGNLMTDWVLVKVSRMTAMALVTSCMHEVLWSNYRGFTKRPFECVLPFYKTVCSGGGTVAQINAGGLFCQE